MLSSQFQPIFIIHNGKLPRMWVQLLSWMLFDIDTNGILSVSAKDEATNKDANVTIAASSVLSDLEIENLVQDAEKHAEADKERKVLIEKASRTQGVCAETTKALGEFAEQFPQIEKHKLNELMEKTEELAAKVQNGEGDVTPDQIREQINETPTASVGLFQQIYAKRIAEGQAQGKEKE